MRLFLPAMSDTERNNFSTLAKNGFVHDGDANSRYWHVSPLKDAPVDQRTMFIEMHVLEKVATVKRYVNFDVW